MTSSRSLDSHSFKELCALAKRLELTRWTHLRKGDLIDFLREHVEPESSDEPQPRTRKTASAEEAERAAVPAAESPRRRSRRKSTAAESLSEPRRTLFDVDASDAEPTPAAAKPEPPKRTRRAKRASEPVKEPATLLPVEGPISEPVEPEKKPRGGRKSRAVADVPVAEETAPKKTRRRRVNADPVVEEEVAAQVSVEEIVAEAPKKRSRRKPKSAEPVVQEAAVEAAEPAVDAEPAPKKRTRRSAKKVEPEIVEPAVDAEPAPKKRTRRTAKKVEPEVVEPVVDAEPAPKKRTRRTAKKVEPEQVEPAVDAEPAPKKRTRRTAKKLEPELAEPVVDAEPTPKKRTRRSTKKVEPELVEPVVDVEPAPKKRKRKSAKKAELGEPELLDSPELDADLEEKPKAKKASGKKALGKKKPPVIDPSWVDDRVDEDDDDIPGWHEVDDDLFDDDVPRHPVPAAPAEPEPAPPASPPSDEVIALKERLITRKIVGSPNDRADRIVLFVCDSYWLRACWEVTPLLVDRIRSAMGKHWHTADPALRVFHVDREGPRATGRRELISELEVSGGFGSWYIPIDSSPNHFMVELGYRSRDGQFFTLISSNTVQTPQRFAHDSFGRSMIDDLNARARLESPVPYDARAGAGYGAKSPAPKPCAAPTPAPPAFPQPIGFNQPEYASSEKSPSDYFNVDVQVVIKGHAAPRTTILVKDDPIPVRSDGTFSVRYSLPERRHVFPITMTSQDGMEKQTIVLALDRNTKKMDPVFKEDDKD